MVSYQSQQSETDIEKSQRSLKPGEGAKLVEKELRKTEIKHLDRGKSIYHMEAHDAAVADL